MAQSPEVLLETVEIPPDGLLVVSVDQPITRDIAHAMIARFRQLLDEGGYSNPVAILDRGVTIEALTDEQLAKIGLMRIPQTE